MQALLQTVFYLIASGNACHTLLERIHCPLRGNYVDLNAFVENSLAHLPSLSYVFSDEEFHAVSFRLDKLAGATDSTSSMLQGVREANIIQFLCSASLPSVHIRFDRWDRGREENGTRREKYMDSLHVILETMKVSVHGIQLDMPVDALFIRVHSLEEFPAFLERADRDNASFVPSESVPGVQSGHGYLDRRSRLFTAYWCSWMRVEADFPVWPQ
ncbi:hypothetical protein SprV_0602237900 [Sparganum proliferum]